MVDGSDSDHILWQQMRQGNDLALGHLFDRYVTKLINYGKLTTPDTGLVEDSIQDVFVNLWTTRKSLSQASSVKGYLYASLRRVILRKINHQKTENSLPNQLDSWGAVEDSYEQWIIKQQKKSATQQAVAQLLQTLTPQQKKVIYLKFYEQLTYEEIANTLQLNIKTVYNIVSSALQRLQKALNETPSLNTALFEAGSWLGLFTLLEQSISTICN
ncbi:RNA polymerase sigma factor [Tunicatimonas pelagia]|uniref:RNA polymerase sigma factor n=1 Tax=Tunicatimonas pelagia TaxID=931531 RepID=UPI0026660577|nr:sigma-70 family RNA polymerase sigma factor [Tunicatimonas pelagia]WKN45449.1 sigma-70 family RNA polymerase sigma factor [Tunicatimonas pelagia]